VRIENSKGATVSEQAFPSGSISVDSPLSKGDYRVISWRRPCDTTCPTTGESGLGDLADVCGRLVHVSVDKSVRVEVAINPDESCQISKTA
jgi:hypothetical protein